MKRDTRRQGATAAWLVVTVLVCVLLVVPVGVVSSANNSTVAHKNPENVSETDEGGDLRNYLVEQLSSDLHRSTSRLSEGDYRRAQRLLGENYSTDYEQYAAVTAEMDSESLARRFRATRETQQRFATTVRRFNSTLEAYDRAAEDGDEITRRKLARRLKRLSNRAAAHATALSKNYTAIERQSDVNLTAAKADVRTQREEMQTAAQLALDETLTPTRLSVDGGHQRTSFRDPVLVVGRLSANGTPVSNRSVRLRIGSQTLRTTTNADGHFGVQYRPLAVNATADRLPVEYVPAPQSPYLASRATVAADVRQTTVTTALANVTETVRYGENVTATVRLNGPPELPRQTLLVTLGNTTLTRANATATNETHLSVPLPADVRTGARTLTVTTLSTHYAVVAGAAHTTVTVQPRATQLNLTTSGTTPDETTVLGRLETANGAALGNQTVTIAVAGQRGRTVTTGPDGTFSARIPLSNTSHPATVTATYAAADTNLDAARAQTAIALPSSNSSPSRRWAIAAALVLGGLAGVRYLYGRLTTGASPATGVAATEATTASPSAPTHDSTSALETASERLSAGDADAAVQLAYAAVRSHLTAATATTHWDVFETHREREGVDEPTLRRLTEHYERAAYGQTEISESTAEAALALARRLVRTPQE